MANPYDQFDVNTSTNPYDQFDSSAQTGNEEDQSTLNLLKQGFSRDLAGAYETIKNSMGAVQLARVLQGESPFSSPEQIKETERKVLSTIGGRETPRSSDIGTNVKEEAIRSVGGPLSYLGVPLKAGAIGLRAASSALTGATAELGGELGSQTEKAIRGEEESGVGRLLGALAGGSTAIPRAAQASAIGQGVGGSIKMAQAARANPEAIADELATGGSRKFLEMIAKEEGIDDLPTYLRNLNKTGSKVTGQDLPLIVSMSDNPAVKSMVTELVQSNPDFRAAASGTIAGVREKVNTKANTLFGDRGQAIPEGQVVKINPQKIQERIASIDDKIAKNVNPLSPRVSKEDIGESIERLVEAKKTAVKQQMQPEYDTVLSGAREAGVTMPPAATGEVYKFVTENNLSDVFGKRTPMDVLIKRNFAPDKNGNFPEVSFDNVDSLKKRINELQRNRLSPEQSLKLSQLEDVVDQARETIPGDWNKQLKAVDQQYYQKLGIPFNVAGVKDIDSKKYAELVAPVITNRGSALKQYLGAVGPEGIPVARDAILSDIWHSGVIKDGQLNQSALSQYMKRKQDVISQIPGFGNELLDIKNADRLLKDKKIMLDSQAQKAQDELAATFFANLKGTPPNWKNLSSEIMNNRQSFNKIFGNGGDLSKVSPEVRGAVTNSFRREILDIASKSSGGSVAYLTDPNNAFVIQNVFGKGYKEKAIEVANLLDKVDKADISRIGVKVKEGSLDPIGSIVEGADAPYLFSQFRDRISSVPQKLARVYSRVKGADIKKKRNEQIMQLLLDPNSTEMLARISKQVGPKIDSPIKAKKVMDAMTAIVPSSMIIGAQVGQSGLGEEEEIQPIPMGSFE